MRNASSARTEIADGRADGLSAGRRRVGRGAGLCALLCLVAVTGGRSAAQPPTITEPRSDVALSSDVIAVAGEAPVPGGAVTLSRNGELIAQVPVTAGHFRLDNLPLGPGANLIEVDAGGAKAEALIFKVTGLSARPAQKVRFQWDDGVEAALRGIASDTRTFAATDAQLQGFSTQVQARTEQLFEEYYRDVARVVVVSQPGSDVTTIRATPVNGLAFGKAPPDCGNAKLDDTVWVYAGFFRANMTDHPEFWLPMKKTDSLALRAEDVAQALARTSAHEFAHSIGLTEHRDACRWMEGDGQGHNNKAVNLNPAYHRLALRFAGGWHVMDPGPDTAGHIRIGEANGTDRGTRRHGHFEPFSASYLALIHPLN